MKLAIKTIVSTSALSSAFLSGCGGDVTPFAKPPTLTDKAQGLYEVQTGSQEIMLSVGANLKGKVVVYSIGHSNPGYAYSGPVTLAKDGTFKGTLTDYYGGKTLLNVTGQVLPSAVPTGLGTFTFGATGSQSISAVKGNQRSQGLENPFKGTYKGTVDLSTSGGGIPPEKWTDTLTITVDGLGNVGGTFAKASDQAFWGFTNQIDEFGNDHGFYFDWDYYFDEKGGRHVFYYYTDTFNNTVDIMGTLDDVSNPTARTATQSGSNARMELLTRFRNMHGKERSPQ